MEEKNNINIQVDKYYKKYRNRRDRLLNFTKKEIEDFDKLNKTPEKNYLLKNKKWKLIGDTYYEIPKPFTYTWFRNLKTSTQIITSILLGGAVVSTAAVPVTLTIIATIQNGIIEIDPSISGKVSFTSHKDENNNLLIEFQESETYAMTGISSIKKGDKELVRNADDGYTYFKRQVTITKKAIDTYKGKTVIVPTLLPKETVFYNIAWTKEIDFGGKVGTKSPYQLAAHDYINKTVGSTNIVLGYGYDYPDIVDDKSGKYVSKNIGETEEDLITAYYLPDTGTFNNPNYDGELYVLTPKDKYAKIVFDNGDRPIYGEEGDYGFFFSCDLASNLILDNVDTSNVTDMSAMFKNCENLTSLNLSCFDTSNVKNMADMFNDCTKLNSLSLSNIKTDNVTDMSFMFKSCKSLASLDLSKFNTSKVTDMSCMFSICSSLTNLDLSNFDTSNVTNMNLIFNDCKSLSNLNISNFNTANLTEMRYMFNYCENLSILDLSSFDTNKILDSSGMFSTCTNLQQIFVSDKFTTFSITSSDNMFEDCKNLKGEQGTVWDENNPVDKTYAHIDEGTSNPGYFTKKN